MDKSFDLDNFKFPGVAGISHNADYYGFGTNKASGTPLNFDEMADDTALCFAKQRAEVVSGNMTITKIDYDIKLIVENGVEVTLPTTNVPNGISATFIPNFAENESATIKIPSHTWELDYTTSLTLSFDGTTWKKNSLYLPEREEREDMRNKINIMLNSCYTGRDLRKVLFELGDFNNDGISDYEEITCPQVMEKLHIRCQNNNFSGLGLGDWVDHDSITIPPSTVKDPHDNSNITWGWQPFADDGYLRKVTESGYDGTLTLIKNDIYKNTRLRIASFGCNYNTNSVILFEYENCPFRGQISNNTGNVNDNNFGTSCLKQWLNDTFYTTLKSSIGDYIVDCTRRFYAGTNNADTNTLKIFLPDASEVLGYPISYYNQSYSIYYYSQWPVYATKPNAKIKKYKGADYFWWLSSYGCGITNGGGASYNGYFVYIDRNSVTFASHGSNSHATSPAFCIG